MFLEEKFIAKRYFPYQLVLFEFGFQGFYFLLSVKFLLAKGLARLKLTIF